MMEITGSSETFVSIYQTTRHHILEGSYKIFVLLYQSTLSHMPEDINPVLSGLLVRRIHWPTTSIQNSAPARQVSSLQVSLKEPSLVRIKVKLSPCLIN
jgi:hypothetical protein